ncbi:hypothetical protein Bphyt_3037 [Paraburkholderia phytofirmans PsJN]|uniref:Uncharacterized protein n=1 Tax=Paraburkholderia phytofirmans (strain DSM 17436 / LMG 22146 / PsJN) TaxID=398527 RepID=B2T665_PARPJ|nr:hypothetical protein Bphyt_3037 [Paraburkholderia phytofirmans PsJN]
MVTQRASRCARQGRCGSITRYPPEPRRCVRKTLLYNADDIVRCHFT